MKNVYDGVQALYEHLSEYDPVLPQAVVERYFRKKVWQGTTSEQVEQNWLVLELFIKFITYEEILGLEDLELDDYRNMLLWIVDEIRRGRAEEEALKEIFAILTDFYEFLQANGFFISLQLLKEAETFFIDAESLMKEYKVEKEKCLFHDQFDENELLDEDVAYRLNLLLERLLANIGHYFKEADFIFDFNRALYLYTGPFQSIPDEEGEEFWLGFWDYFLFDYHLLSTDENPLRHFYRIKEEVLSHDEKHVLRDLLRAKFTVFYIHRILDEYMAECVNLFTGESILLPMPQCGVGDYKKVLFYGHIYSQGIVMLNYISSAPVSIKFRKRIKEEILRQKEIYMVQQPNASLEDFFTRNAIVVRHTIEILVTLAKVNVVSPTLLERDFPVKQQNSLEPDLNITIILQVLAKKYKLSLYDTKLLIQMWHDYANHLDKPEKAIELAATALLTSFAEINGIHEVTYETLLKNLDISKEVLNTYQNHIYKVLQLRKFDPRYLTEEGFVLSLYAF